jgi:2-dehydropantoate 2-reductase
MHFLIVGPGAMGCLFGTMLSRAGHRITLLDYREERARLIRERGIRMEGISGEHTVVVDAVTSVPAHIPDVVLVCVKANSTEKVAHDLAGWIPPRVPVLTLQNGLGNVEQLEEALGRHRVIGGITAEGATLLGPGHIRHAGRGDTLIGTHGAEMEWLARIARAFKESGFETRSVEDLDSVIWGKLIINVGINALTAVTRLKNGRIPQVPATGELLAAAVEEAVKVAQQKRIRLPYEDPVRRVEAVCEATAENIASMLQDVLNHRLTEVAFINGAIVREAMAASIPTPVNWTLTRLVEAIEQTYDLSVAHL